MKNIIIVLIMLCYMVSGVSALNDTYYNATFANTYTPDSIYINPDLINVENPPIYAINDTHFLLKNLGTIEYTIYMHDYNGNLFINGEQYVDSYCGLLKPGCEIVLISEASYVFYASDNVLVEFTDVENIKNTFNTYWLIGFIALILMFGVFVIIRKVIK